MAEVQELDGQEIGELETVTAQVQEQEQQQAKEAEPDIPEKYRGKSVLDIVKMHQDTERSLSRQGQELDGQEIGELETVSAQAQEEEQKQEQQQAKEAEPDIPEKYRGKSVLDIVKMHQDTERSLSRQGQELGEIRKLADELIKSTLTPKQQVQQEQPKEVDFFENPQEAIKRAVESNPRVMAAEQYALQAQREQAKQKLQQLHPDFPQIIQDSDFATWVGASPVRQQLLKAADNYDLNAAHELFSTFKELKQVRQVQQQAAVSTVEAKARDKAMQAAAVDTGGSGESSRKIYRRADLIKLQIQDRAKYESMMDEIMAAYQEGRVR